MREYRKMGNDDYRQKIIGKLQFKLNAYYWVNTLNDTS